MLLKNPHSMVIFEGLRAKRAYIEFLTDFHVLQDQANFWQTDFFWHEKHHSVIVSVDLRFVLQKWPMQKTQLSSGDLLFNEKQKKPFVLLSFISHIIMVISYCCFVSASDWGAERGWCEFLLSWHRFETRSADFCFLFFYLFLYLFQKPKHLFKQNMQSKLLKVIV